MSVQAFLEGLLEAFCTQAGQGEQGRETALLLSAATVELLRGHPLLADHAVSLGYVDRLLKLLAARLPATSKGVQLKSCHHLLFWPACSVLLLTGRAQGVGCKSSISPTCCT